MSAVIVRVHRVDVCGVGPLDRAEHVTEEGEILLVEYRHPTNEPGVTPEVEPETVPFLEAPTNS